MSRVAFVLALLCLPDGVPSRDGADFFEAKIRPVLIEHCYRCHALVRADGSPNRSIKGGLRLDSRAGWVEGGERGPAVVPGSPDESVLIRALRYEDPELEMPPSRRLPESVIADFERWVAIGAPDPRGSGPVPAAATAGGDPAASHWAFRPVERPAVPKVADAAWALTPIDRFVLSRLEAAGLSPSPPADRRTLIRRVYYDLIGLPPSAEDVAAFEADRSPQAFAKVVDRLLASPHYGERWGRHWLDVARYADTKDLVLVFGDEAIRPYAYTYRDYVIRALAVDVPYDRFIHEQLAADQIEPPVAPWRLGAMGFLTLGRLFDENPPDIYDDQIDAVTRGLLGLAVSCARCHDHKYDPIPTEDYYSLYGVFSNSVRPVSRPLAVDPRDAPGHEAFEAKARPVRAKIQSHLDRQYESITDTARRRTADYLLKVATEPPDPLETAVFFLSLSPDALRPQVVARWRRALESRAGPDDPVFGLWHDLMALPEPELAERSGEVVARWLARPAGIRPGELNPLLREALSGAAIASRTDLARLYGNLLAGIYAASRGGGGASDPGTSAARVQLLAVLTGKGSPTVFPRSETYLYMDRVPRTEYQNLLQELDRIAVKDPSAPPRAMVLVDAPEIYEPRVFARGNPNQPGKEVPRRFLRVLAGDARKPFATGSGRLDLARAVTAPENPLTSRVIANRVWMHHFGEPLVSTPSDFGTRSDPPANPELLDHMASTLVDDGWSLKVLHRRILLSNAYQQASRDRPECREVDPENRLLWRAHRRRLELEPMRDTLLAVSGRLDRTMFGRPADLARDPAHQRRTVYGLIDRQQLPALFRVFDFASPDHSAARRPETTVPQQALFGMNSPFVIEQAKALAARPEVAAEDDPRRRIAVLYRIVLQRKATCEEVEAALEFLDAASEDDGLPAWVQYAQALLLTNELLFID